MQRLSGLNRLRRWPGSRCFRCSNRRFSSSHTHQVQEMQRRMKDNDEKAWESLWEHKITPWALNSSTPALKYELKHNFNTQVLEPLRKKAKDNSSPHALALRVLVPGCGDGYDLIEIARHCDNLIATGKLKHASIVGLDISHTAIQTAARELEDACEFCPCERPTRVDLVQGDFFDPTSWSVKYSFPGDDECVTEMNPEDPYDFVFEYVFFCALHPTQRSLWGEQIRRSLKVETGKLLTFMFPISPKGDALVGPPYPVSVRDYELALGGDIIHESPPYKNPETIRPREGLELACWWKRTR